MREHGVPQFTVDAHRAGRRVRPARRLASPPSSATPTCSTALDLAGIPLHAGRPRRRRTRSSSPAGTPRSTPSRSPTSSTPPCSATASRRSLRRSPTSSAAWKAEGRPGGRDELLLRLARDRRRLRAALLRRRLPARRPHRSASRRNRAGVPWRVAKHTVMDLDEWPYPKQPLVPLAETRARADERRDLPRLHPRLPVLPGRHDHPPGARADASPASARWSSRASTATGFEEVGLLVAVQRRPLRDRPRSPRGSPTATRAPTPACRCRAPASTRSTSTLANELSRNGRRSGLTFAPEGGSERMRKVINKMVTEEDLIRTVADGVRATAGGR